MASLLKLISSFSELNHERGKQWEVACKWFLENDPVYKAQIKKVWLWDDWSGRWGADAGIDLIAETHDGSLWAIQAKAYDQKYAVKKADIDSFLSESSRKEISYRLLMATTNKLARNAQKVIRDSEKPVGILLLEDLSQSDVVWATSASKLKPVRHKPKKPRKHQKEAIKAVVSKFEDGEDRGQLIMACGTGKTMVSLWVHEALQSKRTLVLAPSLSLLKQTISEWIANASEPFEFLPVCSDQTVTDKDALVGYVADLGYPATGNAEDIAAFLRKRKPRVVFSTYQSSPVVAEALKDSPKFDFVVADEAHRCAGSALGSFATVLDDSKIPARRRLFQTATPRHFTGKVRKEAREEEFEIASMDDDERFGSIFHRLSFSEAIKRKLLTDYQVLVIGVDDETYKEYAKAGTFVTRDGEKIDDARTLSSQIGLAKAMGKYNLRRVLTFHSRVASAKEFANTFPDVIEWMPDAKKLAGHVWADYVVGTMSAGQRATRIQKLRDVGKHEHGLLSNARCLSEGVDIPALDGVAFIDPKTSTIDITQAVGRAIRLSDGKEIGTIVIPVFIDDVDDPEVSLASSAFKPVWSVVRALREHDDDLAEQLDELRRSKGRSGSGKLKLPSKIKFILPKRIGKDFADAFKSKLVENAASVWEEGYASLVSFIESEGHALVEQKYKDSTGFKLGIWVSKQRENFKSNTLSADRISRLEEIDGWVWSAHPAKWEQRYESLVAFVESEGHALLERRYKDSTGFKLGIWVRTQRKAFKSNTLSADQVSRLEELNGWVWDFKSAQWEEGYASLVSFVESEGHALVEAKYKDSTGFALGNWVSFKRQNFNRNTLSADRVSRLEEIDGWVWSAQAEQWEEGYASLVSFIESEGHALVEQKYKDSTGFKLGIWVSKQRENFKSNTLSADRIKQLEQVNGWLWTVNKKRT